MKLLKCEEQVQELISLERHNSALGNVSISGRSGVHDDIATVVALCARQVIWLMPRTPEDIAKITPNRDPSVHEKCMTQIINKKRRKDMLDRLERGGYYF